MRKISMAGLAIFITILTSCSQSLPDLRVSENGRYLETVSGKPFYWFGDTDWVMFHRTSPEDARIYFKDRAAKGFNVIQAGLCAAGVIEGVTDPAHNLVTGLLPFQYTDSMPDPAKPNEEFFMHAERMIDLASEYGLYIALLPTWAEFVCPAWHNGPKIFNTGNARLYGEYLGKRFADKTNLIWVIGGDRNPHKCDSSDIEIWRAIARGIKRFDPGHLMTFHPQGNSCSDEWFHGDEWLDFNMYQSIRWPQNIVSITRKAYDKVPSKPVVNGEPFYYENRQIDAKFDDRIFRSQPYWTFIAGGRGYTFGQHHVWFFDKNDPYKNFENNTGIYWYDKLDTRGTRWAVRAADIFRSLDWWKFIPDPAIILEGRGEGTDETVACRTIDNSIIMVYFPTSSEAKLDLSILGKNELDLTWYKTDEAMESNLLVKPDQQIFAPPGGWEDALLIISI